MSGLDDALFARTFTWEDARGIAGDTFLADAGAGESVALVVERVDERPAQGAMRQFAILLRGPAEPLLAQATYRLRHARLGDYAIFLTPLARTAAACTYEACFAHAG